jgi:hypothetical protein
MGDLMPSATKCYTCGRSTAAHAVGCPDKSNLFPQTPPPKRDVLGEDFGVLVIGTPEKEIVADMAPKTERTWQDILAEGAGKPTPQQALALWEAMHEERKRRQREPLQPRPSVKVMRGALPLCNGGYVDPAAPYTRDYFPEQLSWSPIAAGKTLAFTMQPDCSFRADRFFVVLDAAIPRGIVLEKMVFSNVNILLASGSLPVEAFPVSEFEPCPKCGATCRSERPALQFPTLTPANRVTVYFKNESGYDRRLKAWFEGLYAD